MTPARFRNSAAWVPLPLARCVLGWNLGFSKNRAEPFDPVHALREMPMNSDLASPIRLPRYPAKIRCLVPSSTKFAATLSSRKPSFRPQRPATRQSLNGFRKAPTSTSATSKSMRTARQV